MKLIREGFKHILQCFKINKLLEPTLGLSELIPGLYISYSFLLMLFRVWAAFSQLGQLGESQIELRRFTGN